MNRQFDELLQVRAILHGVSSIFRLMTQGDQEADPVDGLQLSTDAEQRINAMIETTQTGGA